MVAVIVAAARDRVQRLVGQLNARLARERHQLVHCLAIFRLFLLLVGQVFVDTLHYFFHFLIHSFSLSARRLIYLKRFHLVTHLLQSVLLQSSRTVPEHISPARP